MRRRTYCLSNVYLILCHLLGGRNATTIFGDMNYSKNFLFLEMKTNWRVVFVMNSGVFCD